MSKHRYVIQPNAKESFVSVNTMRRSENWERGVGILTGVNQAAKFGSLSEAHHLWDSEIRAALLKWDPRMDVTNPNVLELPTNGLELEENEIELYTMCNNIFDKENPVWERLAIKEVSSKEALTILANFEADPILYEYQPQFYFWNDLRGQIGCKSGGFYEGDIKSLYGYQFKTKKFLSENLVGAFYNYDHCGTYRTIDSGFLMPFIRKDGDLRWISVMGAKKYVEEYGYKLEEIKPAFESSLDVDKFMKSLDVKLNEKYY